jgi:hypothetical protein
MHSPQITLGCVYEMESFPNPVRIVAFDDQVVMYDTWWPHRGAWAMAKLLGAFVYYRMPRTVFEAHSRFVRNEPLSEQELNVHRPDLPFAFAQRSDLSWYEPWGEPNLLAGSSSSDKQPILDAPAIFLAPFGLRNSAKPPSLVHAENGRFFTEVEVLQAARILQQPFVGEVRLTKGVGIHRSGIKKRLPSFYLWGAMSRLDAQAENAASRVNRLK